MPRQPRPRLALAGRAAIGTVMIVLLAAAASKLADVSAFARDLKDWKLLPADLVPLLAIAVPVIELGLGLSWFLGLKRRWIPLAAAAVLVAFTGLYAAHVALGEPPACACFGKWLSFKESQKSSAVVLARNGALLAVLLAGWFLAVRMSGGTGPGGRQRALAPVSVAS